MTINEEITLYLAKDITEGKDMNLRQIHDASNKYLDKIDNLIENFGQNPDLLKPTIDVAIAKRKTIDSTNELKECFLARDYKEILTEEMEKRSDTLMMDEVVFITRKDIDNGLSDVEKQEIIKNYNYNIEKNINKFKEVTNCSVIQFDISPNDVCDMFPESFDKLYSKEEQLDLFEKWKLEEIKEKHFESAYDYAKKTEILTEDLAIDLAKQIGWKNFQIQEIQGNKYIYNADEHYEVGAECERLAFQVFKIGEILDSNGKIFKSEISCLAKDFYENGFISGDIKINKDNGSMKLYNDESYQTYNGIYGCASLIDPLYKRFMDDVVIEHGTNTDCINSAISAIQEAKCETPDFGSKLLRDTLNSEEYKYAFEQEQSKNKEIVR